MELCKTSLENCQRKIAVTTVTLEIQWRFRTEKISYRSFKFSLLLC